MEPQGGAGGPFGGPGMRPGGPRGSGMFVAPAFLREGDQNHDGKISRGEFSELAEKWFAGWDKEKRGSLDSDQIRDGLNSALGGRPPGPGGAQDFPARQSFLQGAEGKRNGIASAMGIEFDYVHADVDFEGLTFKDAGVRYKGNGTFLESRGSLKRPVKLDLNKHVKGQKLAGITKLNLHNNVTDASWMNEVLYYQLYRDAK